MKRKPLNLWDFVIFVLSLILIFLIIYNFIKSIYYRMEYIPRNSINVSPITGERISTFSENLSPIEVTYSSTENAKFLAGISEADIIYEYLGNDDRSIYKAIFYTKQPIEKYPVSQMNVLSLKSIPKFTFKDIVDIQSKYTDQADYIFVNHTINNSSNFIYKDGSYRHFKNEIEDKDPSNDKPIIISNIIIQYIQEDVENVSKEIRGNGKGVLFCGGKIININWENHNSPIKITDEEGNPISLMRGNTWWILLKEPGSVVYK